MALAIDGTPVKNTLSAGTSLTMTYAAVTAGSIIVVEAGSERTTAAGSHATISVSSSTLGAFAKRADGSIDNAGAFNTYSYGGYWWAYSPNALTNEVITVTYSATVDCAVATAFAVTGFTGTTYHNNPWDQNASLGQASLTTSTALTVPSVAGISTTNADVMLFGFLVGPTNVSMTATSPFALVGTAAVNTTGTNEFAGAVENDIVSAIQNSITVGMNNGSAINTWIMWADALSQTGGGGGGSPTDDIAPRSGLIIPIWY